MFRIKRYPQGWVVEVKKRKWWGKTYWTHYISVSGIPSQPWYHSTFDYAMMNLVREVRFETIESSDPKEEGPIFKHILR
jgi:hypothetical protein